MDPNEESTVDIDIPLADGSEEVWKDHGILGQYNSVGRRRGRTYRKLDDPTGFDFFNNYLKAPKYVMAPMVDGSELAYRTFGRRYNVQLAYTPMALSPLFLKKRVPQHHICWNSDLDDTPLISQICGTDPDIVAVACKKLEPYCEAIDLNLGCPQRAAKRSGYGAFLADNAELTYRIVESMEASVTEVPIFCKIRVFEQLEPTVTFAQQLEKRGIKCLAVHGRIKEMKGKGPANYDFIREIKRHLSIPVVANGDIRSLEDAERVIAHTGCQAVMAADGILNNPAIFTGVDMRGKQSWRRRFELVKEYLQVAEQFPTPKVCIDLHLHAILVEPLAKFPQLRFLLESRKRSDNLLDIINQLEALAVPYSNDDIAAIAESESQIEAQRQSVELRIQLKAAAAQVQLEPLADPTESGCASQ